MKCKRNGFTLVEAIMSMLIVSVLLVAAMRETGASGLVQYKTAERSTARLLADGLMNDILTLAYEDPNNAAQIGLDAGETSASRASFNDVDDFHGWTESPPQNADGTAMPNLSGWKRSVTVERINLTSPAVLVAAESGVKRITVTVTHNNIPAATRMALRSKAP